MRYHTNSEIKKCIHYLSVHTNPFVILPNGQYAKDFVKQYIIDEVSPPTCATETNKTQA